MSDRVISADNHIMDPKDLYVERLPQGLRDRAPRVVRGVDGGDGWTWDGRPPKRTFGLEAVAGHADADGHFRLSGLTWDEILPGNYDGAAHLADMDLDGIDGVVVYPTVATSAYSMPDTELGLAVMRAYSDWILEEFETADPTRLVGLCPLPVDEDIDVSVAEAERLVAKGARGFFLPGLPQRPYWDPFYDPLWRTASESQTVVSFHRTHGGRPKADEDEVHLDLPGINVGGIVVRFFSSIASMTNMIFTGVFERFPSLKVVAGEVNCGWLPFWMENMDQQFHKQRHWSQLPFDRPPSSYVGTNVFVTTLDDHVGFAAMKQDPRIADAVLYSCDYPHSVTLWPNSQRHIAELTKGMDPALKAKVLAGNADRLYRFTSRTAA